MRVHSRWHKGLNLKVLPDAGRAAAAPIGRKYQGLKHEIGDGF
jgi:hypothetical protein